MGHKQYVQDNDEKYPLVTSGGATYGWGDSIQPYLKRVQILQCPNEPTVLPAPVPNAPGYTDYWMNARFSGVPEAKVNDSASTILAGDGNDGSDVTDARYALWGLPQAWLTAPSPLSRHVDGSNYAFVDGHVKWLKMPTADFPLISKAGGYRWKP